MNARPPFAMTAKQRFAAGIAGLMIVTIAAFMPTKPHASGAAGSSAQRGTIGASARTTAELPHEEVRDLTYN